MTSATSSVFIEVAVLVRLGRPLLFQRGSVNQVVGVCNDSVLAGTATYMINLPIRCVDIVVAASTNGYLKSDAADSVVKVSKYVTWATPAEIVLTILARQCVLTSIIAVQTIHGGPD